MTRRELIEQLDLEHDRIKFIKRIASDDNFFQRIRMLVKNAKMLAREILDTNLDTEIDIDYKELQDFLDSDFNPFPE